jgi:hypothetical protein
MSTRPVPSGKNVRSSISKATGVLNLRLRELTGTLRKEQATSELFLRQIAKRRFARQSKQKAWKASRTATKPKYSKSGRKSHGAIVAKIPNSKKALTK